jgi:hypothetical protein
MGGDLFLGANVVECLLDADLIIGQGQVTKNEDVYIL